MTRTGSVALIGRSNVGKSTFLNAALGEPLAIVSQTAQTTRTALLGIVHGPLGELRLLDTPGLHQPRSELGRRMNAAALESARTADLILYMTDVASLQNTGRGPRRPPRAERPLIFEEDRTRVLGLPPGIPVVLAVNKVDQISDKSRLLPLLEAFSHLRSFDELVPLSCREPADVERLLALLYARLPEGTPLHADDELTDRPERYFVAEYIREQVLLHTAREVPHAVAVTVDTFEDHGKKLLIRATLHVEKAGQRSILIGQGGAMIRAIGIGARHRIQTLLGRPARLELFVRATPHWKEVPRQLAELGYDLPSITAGIGPKGSDS